MVRTSIIIPTHNRADMVREAIDSALAIPGSAEREVVVINDGSTDGTASVLAGYGDRIRAIDAKHGERSRARNAGIEAARGEYLCFLDDDDAFLSDGLPKLEAALAAAKARVAAVYGRPRYVRVDPDHPLQGNITPGLGCSGEVLPTLLRGNFIVIGNVLVRREVVADLGGFDPASPPIEDYDLWLRVAMQHEIQFTDVQVAEIRLHATNSTANTQLAGEMTERVVERNLLSKQCLRFAKQPRENLAEVRRALADLCLDLAKRRWWEGDLAMSRKAHAQAWRLSPRTAASGLGVLWRAWLPFRRPRWEARS